MACIYLNQFSKKRGECKAPMLADRPDGEFDDKVIVRIRNDECENYSTCIGSRDDEEED